MSLFRSSSPTPSDCSTSSSFSDHQPPTPYQPLTPALDATFPRPPSPHTQQTFGFSPKPPAAPPRVRLIVDRGPEQRTWTIPAKVLVSQSACFARLVAPGGESAGLTELRLEEDRAVGWRVMLDALTDPGFWMRSNLTLYDVYALLHLAQKYEFSKVLRNAERMFDLLCEREDRGGRI